MFYLDVKSFKNLLISCKTVLGEKLLDIEFDEMHKFSKIK